MSQQSFLRLLFLSIRVKDLDEAQQEAEDIIHGAIVDWEALLEEARLHDIIPQLKRLFYNVHSGVPAYVKEELDIITSQNLLRQLRLVNEFLRVKEELDSKGVPAIPFKGFWLGNDLYGNIADRISGDLDLFIDIADINEIKKVMASFRYVPEQVFTLLSDDYILKEFAEYNFDLRDEDSLLSHLEFHWRIGSGIHDLDIRMEDLKSHIESSVFQGQAIEVFDRSASFLLTLMHHGGKDQLINLKQILDIALFLKDYERIDWTWLLTKVRHYHLVRVLAVGVLLAHEITGVPVPSSCNEIVCQPRIIRVFKNRLKIINQPPRYYGFRTKVSGWIYRIRTRDSFKTRAGFIKYLFKRLFGLTRV